MIDDAHIEIDGGYGEDGREIRAHLILGGDFVDQCLRYLQLEDVNELSLRIPRDVAEELHASLTKELFG